MKIKAILVAATALAMTGCTMQPMYKNVANGHKVAQYGNVKVKNVANQTTIQESHKEEPVFGGPVYRIQSVKDFDDERGILSPKVEEYLNKVNEGKPEHKRIFLMTKDNLAWGSTTGRYGIVVYGSDGRPAPGIVSPGEKIKDIPSYKSNDLEGQIIEAIDFLAPLAESNTAPWEAKVKEDQEREDVYAEVHSYLEAIRETLPEGRSIVTTSQKDRIWDINLDMGTFKVVYTVDGTKDTSEVLKQRIMDAIREAAELAKTDPGMYPVAG